MNPQTLAHPLFFQRKAFQKAPEAKADEDWHSHTTEESMDQNLPHNSYLNEDKLLGPPADVSIPGGHSDDSIALVVSRVTMTCKYLS